MTNPTESETLLTFEDMADALEQDLREDDRRLEELEPCCSQGG